MFWTVPVSERNFSRLGNVVANHCDKLPPLSSSQEVTTITIAEVYLTSERNGDTKKTIAITMHFFETGGAGALTSFIGQSTDTKVYPEHIRSTYICECVIWHAMIRSPRPPIYNDYHGLGVGKFL